MTDFLPPVVAVLVSEIGQFKAGMAEASEIMTKTESNTTKLAALGKAAFLGIAAAAAAVGVESVKLAANFDQTMEQIHTQAGASQAEVDALKNAVLDLAPAVGIGPEKLAEGLYHIESTGLRGKAALDVLTQAAKLAAVGVADLDDVTYAMSGVMSIGMKDVKDASDAISYMNATVGMGDMRMAQLTAAIGTGVLPSFKSAGLGMKDFSAALATIADNSTPADEAATRLRMTIGMMAAPSGPARAALESIGLSATALAEDLQRPDGLLVAVQDLKHHLEASGLSAMEQNATIEKAFGGAKTSGAILTLLEETDRLKSKYEQLGTVESRAAATDEAWQQQQKQFSQQWHELTAQLEVYGIKIGNKVIPMLQDAVDWTKKHKDAAKDLAEVVGGALTVAMAAYAVKATQAAIATFAATWEFVLVAAAVGFAAYEILRLNDRLNELHVTWGQFFKIAGAEVYEWFYKYINPIWDKVMAFFGVINAPNLPKPNLPKPTPPDLTGTGLITGSTSGTLKHYADGGLVPGMPGEATLAVVHGGEFVLSRDMLASLRAGGQSTPLPPLVGRGQPSETIVHAHVSTYLDGELVHEALIPHAQRRKERFGTTGLS